VLYLVFSEILRFGSNVESFPVLLLLNIMLFQVFVQGTSNAIRSLVARENLIRKTQFPGMVIPCSITLSSAFTLGLSLVVVFGYFFFYGLAPLTTWLLLPAIVVPFLVLTFGVSMLLSALYVRYRDLAQVWPVITRALFYASVVLYPIEFVPEDLQYYLLLNPAACLIVQARVWLIDPQAPGVLEVMGGWLGLLGPAAVFAGLCIAGYVVFARTVSASSTNCATRPSSPTR